MDVTPIPIPRHRSGWYGARMNKMPLKYFITTFGCQMNKSDSERVASVLEKMGYKSASKENEANLILVNMCSVRQSAVDRVYGLLPKFKKLKTKNKNYLKTVLTGCILNTDRKKFGKEFDLILEIKDLPNWPKHLKPKTPVIPRRSPLFNGSCYSNAEPRYSNNFSAFVPISRGCNNFCAYCVVPFTRGALVCRDYKEILEEVKKVTKQGFKEIWLLGQNVNDYHSPTDSSTDFPKLLKMVNDIPGNFWIRFTSPNPKDFLPELIDVMNGSKKITEYLNLPVQSGDNKILKKMNRGYTAQKYKNLVKKIREKIPEICLSTDIIVGFPDETKKQFENTAKLFKEIKFDMAYIAQYSPRPGTMAVKMEDNIPPKEKKRRWEILARILKKTALKKNKKYIGRTLEVLVEAEQRGYLRGKTRNYKTIKFRGPENLISQFVKVKIIDVASFGLKGKFIELLN